MTDALRPFHLSATACGSQPTIIVAGDLDLATDSYGSRRSARWRSGRDE